MRTIGVIFGLLLLIGGTTTAAQPTAKHEFRGAWIATVLNLDWPTSRGTNAALQHQWVNQDEWLGVEDWVRALDDDQNNRVCSISGPIYSEIHTSVQPNGRPAAAVPSAFFKVVMFRHRDTPDALSVRAFIVPQNAATMRASPAWIDWQASATLRRPEPHTWLIVIAVLSTGMSAPTAACSTFTISSFSELMA